MRFLILNPGRTPLLGRAISVGFLIMVCSGWTTCNAMFGFNGCEGTIAQPQISSVSPNPMASNVESVVLSVDGSGFVQQSQIMWNGSALPTTFVDARHLQATITQETLASSGGSGGGTAEISVMTPAGAGAVAGCPNGGSSAGVFLVIN